MIKLECKAGNPTTNCVAGASFKCDDRTDCTGTQVCCAQFDQFTGYRSSQCQNSCNSSPIPGSSAVRFCDVNNPVDECTSIGKTCSQSGSVDGLYVCK